MSRNNGKRIAKNTLLLYFRMLFIMVVSLFTSRIVLNTLGIEDYGIYSVVGGVISLLGFITSSLSGASTRYIIYALGEGNIEKMSRTFGNIVVIHLILAIFILIVGETVGLWFVCNKLQIPEGREVAAIWVYQFSILTAMIGIISVPYNAAIVAHERMSAFAYISIVDVVLKLLIVYLLLVVSWDKLVIYAALLCVIQLFDRVLYSVYCRKYFSETTGRLIIDKKQFKDIFVFAGWTMNGTLAVMGCNQGLNILLNLFFGPVVNAARGIAGQVQSVASQFCANFQIAINPQLTKSYAQRNFLQMHDLIIASSKYSFFLMMFICLPLMFEAGQVLKWWLGIVPDHTVIFLRWGICISLLGTLSNPIGISVHATGNLKKFQLIEGTMLLMIVPISYLLLKFYHIPPEGVLAVHFCIELVTQFARVKIVLPMVHMNIRDYFQKVIFPILRVMLLAPILPMLCYYYLSDGIFSFFILCVVCVCSSLFVMYFIGCTDTEKTFLIEWIRKLKMRRKLQNNEK